MNINNPFFEILSKDNRKEIYSFLPSIYNFYVLACVSRQFNEEISIQIKERYSYVIESKTKKKFEKSLDKSHTIKEEIFKAVKNKQSEKQFYIFVEQFYRVFDLKNLGIIDNMKNMKQNVHNMKKNNQLNEVTNNNKALYSIDSILKEKEKLPNFLFKDPQSTKLQNIGNDKTIQRILLPSSNFGCVGLFRFCSFFCTSTFFCLSANYIVIENAVKYKKRDVIEELKKLLPAKKHVWRWLNSFLPALLNNDFEYVDWLEKEIEEIPFRQLLGCAKKGRLDIFQLLYKKNPNYFDKNISTWFLQLIQNFCIFGDFLEPIKWLLDKFKDKILFDQFLGNKFQNNPLITIAAKYGRLKIVKLLKEKLGVAFLAFATSLINGHIEIFKYLTKESGNDEKKTIENCIFRQELVQILEQGHVEVIQLFNSLKVQFSRQIWYSCVSSTRFERVNSEIYKEIIQQNLCPLFLKTALQFSITTNNLNLFTLLIENNSPFHLDKMSSLIFMDQRVEFEKYLIEKTKIQLNKNEKFLFSCLSPTEHGISTVVKKENPYFWNKKLVNIVCKNFSFENLELLIIKGCPFDEKEIYNYSLGNQNLTFLEKIFFDENTRKKLDLKIQPEFCIEMVKFAIENQRIKNLEWLKEKFKIEMNEKWCEFAVIFKRDQILKWLRNQNPKCPWNVEKIQNEIKKKVNDGTNPKKFIKIEEILREEGFEMKEMNKFYKN